MTTGVSVFCASLPLFEAVVTARHSAARDGGEADVGDERHGGAGEGRARQSSQAIPCGSNREQHGRRERRSR